MTLMVFEYTSLVFTLGATCLLVSLPAKFSPQIHIATCHGGHTPKIPCLESPSLDHLPPPSHSLSDHLVLFSPWYLSPSVITPVIPLLVCGLPPMTRMQMFLSHLGIRPSEASM